MANATAIENSIRKAVHGTGFAGLYMETPVKVAAKYKNINLVKVTRANVQLFANLKAYTDVYANAVKRTAQKIASNDADKIASFEKSDNYFRHTDVYSVCVHKNDPTKKYLFCIFNSAKSKYFLDGKEISKADVPQYLTPSEAKKFLDKSGIVKNVKNDILHKVQVRTIKFENIIHLNC